MFSSAPVVVVGGGCAGLSLAVHLIEQQGFDSDIVLVEPRSASNYVHDRTWCMFDCRPHRFSHLASHRWQTWSFAGRSRATNLHSQTLSYLRIPSGAFYHECLDLLHASPRFKPRFDCTVKHVKGDAVEIAHHGSEQVETIEAAHVFDSRPLPASAYVGTTADVCLWQQFEGLEVEITDGREFDPRSMTMMDFRTPQRGAIRFAYVLPYSRRSALVELTAFLPAAAPWKEFAADLEDYLRDVLGIRSWRQTRRERGVIPMTTSNLTTAVSERVTRIGTPGGLVKPSNGYAFASIQRHSRQIAESLARGSLVDRIPARPVSLTLDRIFLSYLSRHPDQAESLFLRIADGVRADRFARFMMNEGNFADDLAVIAAMPKWPFMREAVRSHRCWLKQPRWSARSPSPAERNSADQPAAVLT